MARAPKITPRIPKPIVEKVPPKFLVHKHLQEVLARPQFAEIDRLRGFADLTDEQDLLRDLRREALQLCESISSFVEGLIENPHYQFSWANSHFERAAQLDVLQRTLDFLTCTFDNDELMAKTITERAKMLQADFTEQALRGARSPSQSTSPTSNLAEQMLTKAQANRADSFNWFIRRMDGKKS